MARDIDGVDVANMRGGNWLGIAVVLAVIVSSWVAMSELLTDLQVRLAGLSRDLPWMLIGWSEGRSASLARGSSPLRCTWGTMCCSFPWECHVGVECGLGEHAARGGSFFVAASGRAGGPMAVAWLRYEAPHHCMQHHCPAS